MILAINKLLDLLTHAPDKVEKRGYAIGVRLIALHDNPEALTKIATALAELSRDPNIHTEYAY